MIIARYRVESRVGHRTVIFMTEDELRRVMAGTKHMDLVKLHMVYNASSCEALIMRAHASHRGSRIVVARDGYRCEFDPDKFPMSAPAFDRMTVTTQLVFEKHIPVIRFASPWKHGAVPAAVLFGERKLSAVPAAQESGIAPQSARSKEITDLLAAMELVNSLVSDFKGALKIRIDHDGRVRGHIEVFVEEELR